MYAFRLGSDLHDSKNNNKPVAKKKEEEYFSVM